MKLGVISVLSGIARTVPSTKAAAVLAAVLAVGAAHQAEAAMITFSEAGVGNTSFTSTDGSVLAEYVWTTGLADGHAHTSSTGGNPDAYENGHGQQYQGLRFSSTGAGPLTLASFDLRGSWVVGLLNDGTGTSYSFGTNGTGSWGTQLVGLTASTIYVYATGTAGDLDNVVFGQVSAVPVPAALPLLMAGIGGLGLMGRRRKRG